MSEETTPYDVENAEEVDLTLREYIEKKCIRESLDHLRELRDNDYEILKGNQSNTASLKRYLDFENLILEYSKLAVELSPLEGKEK